jgi:bifunctional non-homologous end joining protein LigD
VKRLAVEVEDHALSYAYFEGEIKEGHYGAGKVIVWDEGYYEMIEKKKGVFVFILFGHKLKGVWSLVQLRGSKNWLLIKKRDKFAKSKGDILKTRPRSVLSKKTIPQKKTK